MVSTAGFRAFSRKTLTFGYALLLVGLAACGGMDERPSGGSGLDAALPPLWPDEVRVDTCEDFASKSVGSYVVSSNYWNKTTCPGIQCMEINTATGAFSVTQGPPPCGDNVSSYPNILYGCSYGNCSPKTILPMPVSAVSKLSSSWSFSVGGSKNDRYNVSYDIWFCPDNNCGASGFPQGLELMIWLDYKNAKGWKDHLGTVKIAGYDWDVWVADMAAGGALDSWKYMNYIIKPSSVTSVTDLDLNAFIKDATTRGYVKSSWYLYAVQAGMEVRTGGMPFTSDKFRVSINGVTPSTDPLPYDGPSCDGGTPSAEGQLAVSANYVTAGALHGYGSAWSWVGPTSEATACVAPICTAVPGSAGAMTCSPALPPSALCTSGAITADSTYNSVAGIGFNLNQPFAGSVASGVDGGVVGAGIDASLAASDLDGGSMGGGIDGGVEGNIDGSIDGGIDGGVASTLGTITIPTSITVAISKTGNLTGNSSLRVQLTDANGVDYCYGGPMTEAIPIGKFNTKCWNNTGDAATPSTRFRRMDIIVPSSAATEQDFSYCLTNVTVQ